MQAPSFPAPRMWETQVQKFPLLFAGREKLTLAVELERRKEEGGNVNRKKIQAIDIRHTQEQKNPWFWDRRACEHEERQVRNSFQRPSASGEIQSGTKSHGRLVNSTH